MSEYMNRFTNLQSVFIVISQINDFFLAFYHTLQSDLLSEMKMNGYCSIIANYSIVRIYP